VDAIATVQLVDFLRGNQNAAAEMLTCSARGIWISSTGQFLFQAHHRQHGLTAVLSGVIGLGLLYGIQRILFPDVFAESYTSKPRKHTKASCTR